MYARNHRVGCNDEAFAGVEIDDRGIVGKIECARLAFRKGSKITSDQTELVET